MELPNRILLIGIGNAGREDDALGWLFLDEIDKLFPGQFDIEYRYQLQVEDAELISHYQKVIFIDAHCCLQNKVYVWQKCEMKVPESSSHELDPEVVFYLTSTIYKQFPETYILGIAGKSFELHMGLTGFAQKNLEKAIDFFQKEIVKMTPDKSIS